MALKWRRCKCSKCRRFHLDVVPESEGHCYEDKHGRFWWSACRPCLTVIAGRAGADRYYDWRQRNCGDPPDKPEE